MAPAQFAPEHAHSFFQVTEPVGVRGTRPAQPVEGDLRLPQEPRDVLPEHRAALAAENRTQQGVRGAEGSAARVAGEGHRHVEAPALADEPLVGDAPAKALHSKADLLLRPLRLEDKPLDALEGTPRLADEPDDVRAAQACQHDGPHLPRPQHREAAAHPQLHPVFHPGPVQGAARGFEGAGPHVRGDGQGNPPRRDQPRREQGVVRTDIGRGPPRQDQAGDGGKAGRKAGRSHVHHFTTTSPRGAPALPPGPERWFRLPDCGSIATVRSENRTAEHPEGGRYVAIRRVLLVEDDPDIQKMAALALRHTTGAEVLLASDGREALHRARADRPDVILLDVMLPDMDGYEVCRRLKDSEDTRTIPVIFLSARAQQAEIERGLSLGAAGYLVKPFDPMTLGEQIEQCLKG